MKTFRLLLAMVVLAMTCSAFMQRDKEKPVYAFGIAASFKDTVVFFTDIQILDSVSLDKKGFLPHRDAYSNQLMTYLEYQKQKPDYTCMIYFSENKNKLQKEASKVKKQYEKSSMTLQSISEADFRFTKPKEEE